MNNEIFIAMKLENKHSGVFNPFSQANAEWIENFLRLTCLDGLSHAEQCEIEDQIAALVPALVELRDNDHIQLNAREIAEFATLNGYSALSADVRLNEECRKRCASVRERFELRLIKALLGERMLILIK